MASSYVTKRLVASTTRRSPCLFVVPYFHRPAAAALAINNRRAFAATPIPKYTFEHYRYKANRMWFNFTGFVNRFSPIMRFLKLLKITPHTFSISKDSRLEASGDELAGIKISLNFPGIEEMTETDEGLRILLDTGIGNWYDYAHYDAKWKRKTTRDGLLIIHFSKVKQTMERIETKHDNGVVKQ